MPRPCAYVFNAASTASGYLMDNLMSHRNPKALASVRRGLADAAAGRTKSLGSFAHYTDEDDES